MHYIIFILYKTESRAYSFFKNERLNYGNMKNTYYEYSKT